MSLKAKTKRNAIIAFIIGLMIGLLIVLGQHQQNDSGGWGLGAGPGINPGLSSGVGAF